MKIPYNTPIHCTVKDYKNRFFTGWFLSRGACEKRGLYASRMWVHSMHNHQVVLDFDGQDKLLHICPFQLDEQALRILYVEVNKFSKSTGGKRNHALPFDLE